MLLQNWSFSSTCSPLLQSSSQINRLGYVTNRYYSRIRTRNLKVSSTFASLRVGTDVIVELAHNKALIAATLCGAVGQLAKPFAASILYKRESDPKAAIQAGGFPSTHSSAAVAIAMSVGLERGFSDSIFGLAVVYAALTMYDAQGVRREVGVHARTLNKALIKNQPNSYSSSDPNHLVESSSKKLFSSESGNSISLEKRMNSSCLTEDIRTGSSCLTEDIRTGSENNVPISSPLKESIGHTEIEVAAGAFLGLLMSLAVYSL